MRKSVSSTRLCGSLLRPAQHLGRALLAPSDRANLYGPYYANHWGSFIDGVQDGYPFETVGRDDGVMYLGQFGGIQVSAGAFEFRESDHR